MANGGSGSDRVIIFLFVMPIGKESKVKNQQRMKHCSQSTGENALAELHRQSAEKNIKVLLTPSTRTTQRILNRLFGLFEILIFQKVVREKGTHTHTYIQPQKQFRCLANEWNNYEMFFHFHLWGMEMTTTYNSNKKYYKYLKS